MDMEMPSRKLNRLEEYDYGLEGAYFVTICTQNRAQLFQMESPVGNGLCAVPLLLSPKYYAGRHTGRPLR